VGVPRQKGRLRVQARVLKSAYLRVFSSKITNLANDPLVLIHDETAQIYGGRRSGDRIARAV